MLRRVLATGVIAGIAAGLVFFLAQLVAVQPLIVEAERLEARAAAAGGAEHGRAAGDEQSGEPEDGVRRAGLTLLANLVTGIGFGLLLAGCFALYGGAVDARRGLLWGLAGYAAFALAPALGLPPEAPGAAGGHVLARQGWWLATVAATAGGLAVLVFYRRWTVRAAGLAVLVLPHLIGAPHADGGGVPAGLAMRFVVASLAATALFWLVLGGLAGAFYRRFSATGGATPS